MCSHQEELIPFVGRFYNSNNGYSTSFIQSVLDNIVAVKGYGCFSTLAAEIFDLVEEDSRSSVTHGSVVIDTASLSNKVSCNLNGSLLDCSLRVVQVAKLISFALNTEEIVDKILGEFGLHAGSGIALYDDFLSVARKGKPPAWGSNLSKKDKTALDVHLKQFHQFHEQVSFTLSPSFSFFLTILFPAPQNICHRA